jgi:glycine/D-amino acid oxidase-like deaminating enzyme
MGVVEHPDAQRKVTMAATARVLVVGGGIVGVATAYRLTEAGVPTTLLDADEPGRGTSASSFAWLNSARKGPRAYHDLNVAGMAEHAALAAEFAVAPWYHPVGGLSWALTPAGQEEQRRDAARQAAWAYRSEAISPERAMRELEPGLRLDPALVPEVWYTPAEGWVDVPALIRELLTRAEGRGLLVRAGAAVVAIDHVGERVSGVTLASGERLPATALVNCAGPRADTVAALLGWDLPLERVPGLLAVTGPVAPPPRLVCHADDITFRPDPGGGLVLAHAEDLDRTVAADTPLEPPPAACAVALRRAARAYPTVAPAGIALARIGVRPIPRDGISVIGRIPGFANAFIGVTHSGVTLGPLLGRHLAALIGGDFAPELHPFSPARFAATGTPLPSA